VYNYDLTGFFLVFSLPLFVIKALWILFQIVQFGQIQINRLNEGLLDLD